MSHETCIHKRRWYDQLAPVPEAVEVTRLLPENFVGLVINSLNSQINTYGRHRRKAQMSLGSDTVLTLYQRGGRKRWYDPKPQLRRAFTMMRTLPEQPLRHFARQVVEVSRLLDIYGGQLPVSASSVPARDVGEVLRHTYVRIAEEEGSIRVTGSQAWDFDDDESGDVIVSVNG